MANISMTLLEGNLTADPKVSQIKSGKNTGNTVVFFNIAVNDDYTNAEGEVVKNTTYWSITVFNRADAAAAQLKKGQTVVVIGRQNRQPSVYAPEGQPASAKLELVADTLAIVVK